MLRAPTRVSSTRRWLLVLVCMSVTGCRGPQETSDLAQRAVQPKATPNPAPPSPPPPEPVSPATPASTEQVALWIDLDPTKTVRILTVGMLELPLVNRPTGFAREETIVFRDCVGEGAERRCVVEHTADRFEAEPPTGKILEQDELRFAGVRSHHEIDARGLKRGDATVVGPAGPPNFSDTEIGRALVDVHRYGCIRLPSEPVAVGAKWSDSCSLLFGGQLARQDVAWELTALSDDPMSGKRAELTMIGKLTVGGQGSERSGTIEGKLYFFVDAHAPHILRLRARVPLKASQTTESSTTLSLQFGHVDATGVVTRTDGQPLGAAEPVAKPGSAAVVAPSPPETPSSATASVPMAKPTPAR